MAKAGLVGQRVRLRLESWGRLGEATAHIDGLQAFVFGGIPGEEVVAEVIQERRRYISARVVEVLDPSPHRVEPPCPYFGACTGCQWQHVDYDFQLHLKRDVVVDALERVGGFHQPPVSDTVPSPDQYGYRNHARFTIGNGGS
ncbi:MAG: 23S rRNA (uracil(1939)-C(5))-methyltransferase RlmD, partial [Dehalococcoidia bacterium]